MSPFALKAPSAWDTVPAGLAASGDVLALDRIEDKFNDGILDAANFGALAAGNGTVFENEALELNSPAAIDAGAIYLKTSISKVADEIYTYRWRPQSGTHYPIFIQQSAGAPIIGNGATLAAIRVIAVYLATPTTLGIFYIDNLGVAQGWNGSAWGPALPTIASVGLGTLYEAQLEVDSANARWRIILRDITYSTVITTTAWVLWANTRNTGSGVLWFGSGDFYNDVISGKMIVSSFRNQFKPGPLVATMGEISGGGTPIDDIPITESVESGATLFWKYNLNRTGLSGAKTLAQLKTDLVGQTFNYLDLESTYTSDGEAAASFDINGGVIASSGGGIIRRKHERYLQ